MQVFSAGSYVISRPFKGKKESVFKRTLRKGADLIKKGITLP